MDSFAGKNLLFRQFLPIVMENGITGLEFVVVNVNQEPEPLPVPLSEMKREPEDETTDEVTPGSTEKEFDPEPTHDDKVDNKFDPEPTHDDKVENKFDPEPTHDDKVENKFDPEPTHDDKNVADDGQAQGPTASTINSSPATPEKESKDSATSESETGSSPTTSTSKAPTKKRRMSTPEERLKRALEKKLRNDERDRQAAQRNALKEAKRKRRLIEENNTGSETGNNNPAGKKLKVSTLNNVVNNRNVAVVSPQPQSSTKKKQPGRPALWTKLNPKLMLYNFARTHPSISIDPLQPWDAYDLENYFDYIDGCIMCNDKQKEVWSLMIEFKVLKQDPGLHEIGTLKCCNGKSKCAIINRAKTCFSKRVTILYCFVFPFMRKYSFIIPLICDKMWMHLDDRTKERFYRDDSPVGIYHEYIDMVIQFPPTKQEGKIFAKAYPNGVRMRPRPTPRELLLPVTDYDRNNDEPFDQYAAKVFCSAAMPI